MASFDFPSILQTQTSVFNGPSFYKTYKDSAMLRCDANAEAILCHGYLIRKEVNRYPLGHSVIIKGIDIEKKYWMDFSYNCYNKANANTIDASPDDEGVEPSKLTVETEEDYWTRRRLRGAALCGSLSSYFNTPLIVKRSGKGVVVGDLEFTYNRLVGLAAAYAYENRARFPALKSGDAEALGLVWDNENEEKCKLYLSALSGAENMIDQFSFFPFLCDLRKFQLGKKPANLVAATGFMKNDEGITMAKVMMKNLTMAKRIWLMFPNASLRALTQVINETPEFKKLFQG